MVGRLASWRDLRPRIEERTCARVAPTWPSAGASMGGSLNPVAAELASLARRYENQVGIQEPLTKR